MRPTRSIPFRSFRSTTALQISRRALRSISALLVLAALAALAGCTTYEPKPIDLEDTRTRWLERSPDNDAVRAFAQRLAETERLGDGRPFDPSDGLSLDEAEAVAVVFNRTLRVERRGSAVARATAENAGLWEDPVLGVELERIIQSVPEPWIVAASIGITIPISGRLDAERFRADTALTATIERIASLEWAHRAVVRATWVEWSSQRIRLELLESLVEELSLIATIAERQQEAGVLSRIDARLFRVELVSRRAEMVTARAQSRELDLELRDLIGFAPDAPVSFLPQVTIAPRMTDDALARAAMERSNSELITARRDYEVADAALRLEIRRQYPDLTIGPGYKREDGDSRILLGLALPLPLWNQNRQGVAESLARRDQAFEEFDATYEHLVSRLAIALTRFDGAREARTVVERDLVPLADQQEADARRSAELGRVDPLLLLEALRSRYESRLRLIDARAVESTAAARLDELIGPPVRAGEGVTP